MKEEKQKQVVKIISNLLALMAMFCYFILVASVIALLIEYAGLTIGSSTIILFVVSVLILFIWLLIAFERWFGEDILKFVIKCEIIIGHVWLFIKVAIRTFYWYLKWIPYGPLWLLSKISTDKHKRWKKEKIDKYYHYTFHGWAYFYLKQKFDVEKTSVKLL